MTPDFWRSFMVGVIFFRSHPDHFFDEVTIMSEKTPRNVTAIQESFNAAADALKLAADLLGLAPLMTELERNYPSDIDTERIQNGEICPPLVWGIHVDVAHAKIQIEEAIQSLQYAANRTEEQVRADWIEEKIKDVNDPSARELLGFVLGMK